MTIGWKRALGARVAHYVVPPTHFKMGVPALCGQPAKLWREADAYPERCDTCQRMTLEDD
jgi:hypothetical protein